MKDYFKKYNIKYFLSILIVKIFFLILVKNLIVNKNKKSNNYNLLIINQNLLEIWFI